MSVHDRKPEAARHFVEPFGFTIALGVRHPEVAFDVVLGAAPLLMAEDHDGAAMKTGQPADDGGIVAERTVAVQFDEAVEQTLDVVERVRSGGMSPRAGPSATA